MRDERGSFQFEVNKTNLKMALRFAWTDGALGEVDYFLLLRRTRTSRTMEDLRAIAHDLARILRARMKGGPPRGPAQKGFSASGPIEERSLL